MDFNIKINKAVVDFNNFYGSTSGYVRVDFNITPISKKMFVKLFKTLNNDDEQFFIKEINFASDCIWNADTEEFFFRLNLLNPDFKQRSFSTPILRVQLYVENEGQTIYSDIKSCKIIFPERKSIRASNKMGEVAYIWDSNDTYNRNLFFKTEVSDDHIVQIEEQLFEERRMVFELNEALKREPLLKARTTLYYGDPSDEQKHISEGWSEYGFLINQSVKTKSVECEKIGINRYHLHVDWEPSELDHQLSVELSIIRGKNTIHTLTCEASDGKFSFENIVFTLPNDYVLSMRYFIDSSFGPEPSQPIPIIYRTPKQFTLNYYSQDILESNIAEIPLMLKAKWKSNEEDEVFEFMITKNNSFQKIFETKETILEIGDEIDNKGIEIGGKIRLKKEKSIGPWSDDVPAPFIAEETYSYDCIGRVVKIDSSQYTSQLHYDERGNIINKKTTLIEQKEIIEDTNHTIKEQKEDNVLVG